MKSITENWKKFINESDMRIYGTQRDWAPPEDDPDAEDPGAWRGFRDNEYLEAESNSGLFFIHSEQKRLRSGELKFNPKGKPVRDSGRTFITHKPSGKKIPTKMILMHPDFQGKNSMSVNDLKKYMKKLDAWAVQNIPDISSETLSPQSEAKMAEFIAGDVARDFYQNKNSNLSSIMENWRSFTNEIVGKDSADALKDFSDASSQTADDMADVADKQQAALDAQTKTSESFQEFANAIGAFSDSISDSSEESDKMLELYQKFEEANLGEFIEKIGELAPLADMMDKVEDGKGAGEMLAGLENLDMDAKEIGEKLATVQELRDEFDEYKTEQEDAQKEREEKQAEKDEEQDKAMKDASRMGTDAGNEAQAEAEG